MIKLFPILCLLGATASGADPATAKFSQDFRRQEFDNEKLLLVGKDAEQFARFTPCGFQLALPPTRDKQQAFVGVSPRFNLSGDFEVTASYQILGMELPESGNGNGINLYAVLDSPAQDAFSLRRFVTPKQGNIYVTQHAALVEGKRKRAGKDYPTQVTSGKLRLKRTGSTLLYLVAEGSSNEYRQLDRIQVGTQDVKQLRIAVESSKSPGDFEVCFQDFQVLAEAFPKGSAEANPTRSDLQVRGKAIPKRSAEANPTRLTPWLIFAGGVIIAVFGLWYWRRRTL